MLSDAVSNVTGPPTEALIGLVERVTFHNADSGLCVLRVKVRARPTPKIAESQVVAA